MAVRREDLSYTPQATVYRFPTSAVRRRARRQMMARRRTTVGMALLFVVVATLGGGGVGQTAPGADRTPRAVVVRPGDTLWGIAERYAPSGADPRAYVAALEELNRLEGTLVAGVRIRLPK